MRDSFETIVELAEFPTPFAQIDPDRLQANITWMQDWVASRGANLRPHFKTHRSARVAQMQLDAGAVGFTCSDVAQLNALLALGVADIFVSSPVQMDRAAWPTLRRAAQSRRVTFSASSTTAVDELHLALGGTGARVWVEIDVGCGRTGVTPEACGDVATAAVEKGLDVCGVFSYPGQGYAPGGAAAASADERRGLADAKKLLVGQGMELVHVSAGSSPTVAFAEAGLITEYRPGTYALRDRQQVALESTSPLSIAMTIITTVLYSGDDRVVLDVGAKSLGRDAPPWLNGHGAIDRPEAPVVSRLYDHHAVVDSWRGPRPATGDRVGVIPNNVNSALALQSAAILARPDASRGLLAELVHDT